MNFMIQCPACGQMNDEQALWCELCAALLPSIAPQPVAITAPRLARLDPTTLQPTGETLAITSPDTALVIGRAWNSFVPDLDLRPWLVPFVGPDGHRHYGISRRQLVIRHSGRELQVIREGSATTTIWLGGQRNQTTTLPANGTWRVAPGDVVSLGDPWADSRTRAPGVLLAWEC